MKKWMAMVLCVTAIAAAAGCGNSSASAGRGKQAAGVRDVLEAGMAEEDGKSEAESVRKSGINEGAPEPEPVREAERAAAGTDGVDLDLTALSSTMVYSEVYNMMTSPESYIGKTIKMEGTFTYFYDEEAEQYYFACVIADATACCSQGIEFVLTDEYTYPDDYPEEGGEICVIGDFDTYKEGSWTYCTLRNARFA